jgi:4-hydroxybenzoate polyprenyltransferase
MGSTDQIATGKKLVRIWFYANFHIALVAVVLSLATFHVFGGVLAWRYAALAALSTFVLYNVQRLIVAFRDNDIDLARSERHEWIHRHRTTLLLTVVGAALIAGLLLWFTPLPVSWWVIAPAVALAFAYAVPVIPIKGKFVRLRDVPMIKVFLVGLVWTYVTAFVPLLWLHQYDVMTLLLWPVIVALQCIALTIPFDIRDASVEQGKLLTLPQVIGNTGAIRIAILMVLTALAMVAMLLWYFSDDNTSFFPMLIVESVWTIIAIWQLLRAAPERLEWYYVAVLDGLLVVLGVALLLVR